MSGVFVCSANSEMRSDCDAGCSVCEFLIGERRARGPGRVQWSRRERRALTNLLPAPAFSYAGAAGAGEGFGKAKPAAWHLLALLALFNLVDCLMTARALSLGYQEGNPVMATLLQINLPMAMFIKTLVVGLGSYVLWRNRHLAFASRGLAALTVLYGLLAAYHLSFQLSV